MMKNKKCQYVMEFLMTYGWAILVVLMAIGSLAYFGVFNPENLLPQKTVEYCNGLDYDNDCDFKYNQDEEIFYIECSTGYDLNNDTRGCEETFVKLELNED